MRALVLLLVAACGRIDFDDPGEGDRDYGDVGSPCVVDDHCGACQRCNADRVCEAEPIVDLYAGHRSTCFLGTNGSRWCVGEYDGVMRSASSRPLPRRIPGEDGWTKLSLGWQGHVGIRNGATYGWNNSGVSSIDPFGDWDLFSNDMDGGCFLVGGALKCANTATPGTWTTAAPGANHTCGLQSDGSLWCWGLNQANALGPGPERFENPTRVGTDTDWLDVGTGDGLSCGIKTNNTLWCWGAAALTGTNMVDTLGVPTQISSATNWSWLEVHWNRACAGTPDGRVWCWGADVYGGMEIVPVPTDLGIVVEKLAMGGHHTCARIAGAWSCWGWNAFGQLASGDTESHDFPGVPFCGR